MGDKLRTPQVHDPVYDVLRPYPPWDVYGRDINDVNYSADLFPTGRGVAIRSYLVWSFCSYYDRDGRHNTTFRLTTLRYAWSCTKRHNAVSGGKSRFPLSSMRRYPDTDSVRSARAGTLATQSDVGIPTA